jgi:hypothetical protein
MAQTSLKNEEFGKLMKLKNLEYVCEIFEDWANAKSESEKEMRKNKKCASVKPWQIDINAHNYNNRGYLTVGKHRFFL